MSSGTATKLALLAGIVVCLASGCQGTGRPSWIEKPQSYFEEPRPDVLLAVGKSRTKTGSMRAAQAENDAFGKLLRQSEQRQETTAGGKTFVTGELGPARVIVTWTDPEGWVYSLARMDRKPDAPSAGE